MSCAPPQLRQFLDALRAVVAPGGTFVAVSEYLGYLPYGQYIHIEVDGVDISTQLPSLWDGGDVEALEQIGAIERIAHQQVNADDSRTTYRIP